MTYSHGLRLTLAITVLLAACGDDAVDDEGAGGSGGSDTTSSGTAGMAPMPPNCSVCGEVFGEGADPFGLCGLQSVLTNGEGTLACTAGTSCSLLRGVQKCLAPSECGVDAGPPTCEDQACIDCVTAACPDEVAACQQDAF